MAGPRERGVSDSRPICLSHPEIVEEGGRGPKYIFIEYIYLALQLREGDTAADGNRR